jgi:hypothetical protein
MVILLYRKPGLAAIVRADNVRKNNSKTIRLADVELL